MADVTEDLRIPSLAQVKGLIDSLTASDVGAMRNTIGILTCTDLLEWLDTQTEGASFNLNPSVTTTNTPVTGAWLKGEFFVNASDSRTVFLTNVNDGSMWFNFSGSVGSWVGWRHIMTADGSVPMTGVLKAGGDIQLPSTLSFGYPFANGETGNVYSNETVTFIGNFGENNQWLYMDNSVELSKALRMLYTPSGGNQAAYVIFGEHNVKIAQHRVTLPDLTWVKSGGGMYYATVHTFETAPKNILGIYIIDWANLATTDDVSPFAKNLTSIGLMSKTNTFSRSDCFMVIAVAYVE